MPKRTGETQTAEFSFSKDILAHIFGSQTGDHFQSGLADAESKETFYKNLQVVKARWNNLVRSCSSNEIVPQFHTWFCQYKADVIAVCVLPKLEVQLVSKIHLGFSRRIVASP